MTPDAVIKVGGSLLDWPKLPARLTAFLNARAGERLLLVPGGGPAADLVRGWDAMHALGDTRAHDLALAAMDFAAAALAAIVPGLDALEDLARLTETWSAGRTPVLAPRPFLVADERRSGGALPHTWDVTSDSIAAHVARQLGVRELVLLKSAPLPRAASAAHAVELGLVDPYFPVASAEIARVFLVNLRDSSAAPLRLAAP